ncbi:MAG: GTP-binding protein [Bacteriovoracaceae bacterium]
MSFVNPTTKEINCKIVYFGPGLGGKTTNIQYIYQKTSGKSEDLISLNTENERTIFFDFIPLELGEIRGYKTRFHLYTVPGQVIYERSRRLVLRGVDGIIFVADSQVEKMDANLESLKDLEANLLEEGYDISEIPMVMQWNKRDLPNIMSSEEMNMRLNKWNRDHYEAIAVEGIGVFDCLKSITKRIIINLKKTR